MVATSKPEPFALRLLEHAGLLASFGAVRGARFDGSVRHKADIVAAALAGRSARHSVMLGDVSRTWLARRRVVSPALALGGGTGPPGSFKPRGRSLSRGIPRSSPRCSDSSDGGPRLKLTCARNRVDSTLHARGAIAAPEVRMRVSDSDDVLTRAPSCGQQVVGLVDSLQAVHHCHRELESAVLHDIERVLHRRPDPRRR